MSVVEPGSKQDEEVRGLVLGLVQSMVDGDVTVSIVPSDAFTTLQVRASAEIMSLLIGLKRQTVRALRTLLAGSGAKLGRPYALDPIQTTQ